MDNKTEEGLKRMVQDYEYETTGIPQRLDHVLIAGLEKGLAQADLKEQQIDIQVDAVVKSAKQVAKKATYEDLKKIFFDYEKMYNEAVKDNKKGFGIKKILKNIFGLASLGSIGIGIASCFFDSTNMPELLRPFSDGGGILMMVAFFVFGIIWWILQAATSLSGEDPEYSGQARIYQSAMGTIIEEGLEKRFKDRFYKDKDFHEYNDMDIFEESELEEAIREDKKNKKTSRIILAIIPIIILVGVIFSINLNSISSKANNSKENVETNSLIENKENEQENTKAKSYIAENGKEFNINVLELENITEQIESSSNLNNKETENTSAINQNTNNITSSNNNNYTNNNTNTNNNNNSHNNNNSNDNTNTTLEQIKLPNLIDLAEAEAINKLKALGLEYSITRNTKYVSFNNPNAGKSIITNIIDKKDYYSQYDRVYLEVNQYEESGISINFIINTKELVNYVTVYVDNKKYSAYYFPNMSSETFYANGRKSVNIKIVLNDYSGNFEIYNKNINLYEANKTVSDDGYTYIDIGTIDYKP